MFGKPTVTNHTNKSYKMASGGAVPTLPPYDVGQSNAQAGTMPSPFDQYNTRQDIGASGDKAEDMSQTGDIGQAVSAFKRFAGPRRPQQQGNYSSSNLRGTGSNR